MIRARTGRRHARPLAPVLVLLLGLLLGACVPSNTAPATFSTGPSSPATSETPSSAPSGTVVETSVAPTATAESPATSGSPGPLPSGAAAGCSGSDANRAFFAQAAAAMTWAVYCPALPAQWFLQNGNYVLANGGILEATYRGPGGAQLSVVEGNVCADFGTDVDRCAPRDLVIGPASLGDQTGELGRLANGLVLDVDRGANPSWRVTGLGLSEADFQAITAAFIHVGG